MSTMDNNRFAPPRAEVADVPAVTQGVQRAGRGKRLGAALVDSLIIGLVFGAVALFTPWNPFTFANTGFLNTALVSLTSFAAFCAIHGYLLAQRGQTVGKLAFNIRIIRTDGSTASLARLLGLRYLPLQLCNLIPVAGVALALIDVLLIFRESRKCLHDNIADTIVITAATA